MITKLVVKRTFRGPKYTIGHLYIDGKYFCDTLEDPDRGLSNNMSVNEIKSKKVYGNTAIPYGTYTLDLDTVSPKYSNYTRYPYVKPYGAKMPRVIGIKGFSGVLIHPGTDESNTLGCLLVGENKVKGKVINSQKTWIKLMDTLLLYKKRGSTFTIEYTK